MSHLCLMSSTAMSRIAHTCVSCSSVRMRTRSASTNLTAVGVRSADAPSAVCNVAGVLGAESPGKAVAVVTPGVESVVEVVEVEVEVATAAFRNACAPDVSARQCARVCMRARRKCTGSRALNSRRSIVSAVCKAAAVRPCWSCKRSSKNTAGEWR